MNAKPVCHRVNRVRDIDIVPCPLRRCQKSSDALVRKKEGKPDVARCNELRRPAKLLPSSAHPPYYGSSSVVENHFEGVSDEVGDLRSGNYNWIDVRADNALAWSEKTL